MKKNNGTHALGVVVGYLLAYLALWAGVFVAGFFLVFLGIALPHHVAYSALTALTVLCLLNAAGNRDADD